MDHTLICIVPPGTTHTSTPIIRPPPPRALCWWNPFNELERTPSINQSQIFGNFPVIPPTVRPQIPPAGELSCLDDNHPLILGRITMLNIHDWNIPRHSLVKINATARLSSIKPVRPASRSLSSLPSWEVFGDTGGLLHRAICIGTILVHPE
ncbi:hypothetical protein BDV59DRAFT_184139, partial [Aspergillus ambiguus]|uniref:uncharacterized protein n=1 Tax=Aspergillus ambiguus TaxID=176160 RepID=UPI003CCE1267